MHGKWDCMNVGPLLRNQERGRGREVGGEGGEAGSTDDQSCIASHHTAADIA